MTRCPGCGLSGPASGRPSHPYLGCSPACWAVYGEVLAREYQDPAYFRVHQLTVDAYAAQHPGSPQPRTAQSTALHLITLCLVLERGADPASGPGIHRRLAARHEFEWLQPPGAPIGSLTVADVRRAADAGDHERRVRAWATSVWDAWEPQHSRVARWIDALP